MKKKVIVLLNPKPTKPSLVIIDGRVYDPSTRYVACLQVLAYIQKPDKSIRAVKVRGKRTSTVLNNILMLPGAIKHVETTLFDRSGKSIASSKHKFSTVDKLQEWLKEPFLKAVISMNSSSTV